MSGKVIEHAATRRPRILGAALRLHQQQPGPGARPLLHGHAQAPGDREGQAVQAGRAAARDPGGGCPDRRCDGADDALRCGTPVQRRQRRSRHELELGAAGESRAGNRPLQPARRAAALHLRRDLHVARHRHHEGRPGLELHPDLQGQGRQPAGRRQVVPPARAAERAGGGVLVGDALRHRDPLDDPEPEQRLGALVLRQAEGERGRLDRPLFRTEGACRRGRATGSRRFPARASTR